VTTEKEEPILITPEMLAGSAETRRDFERGMSFAPPLILLIIALNVAMFVWEIAAGALQNQETITAAGALVRERVAAGEYWRLFSSMFLHGGVDHILGNCIVLYIVGMACEHALGFAQTAAVYFASGLAGGFFSLAMGPGPSVGASGAIFGVVIAVVVILYRHQRSFYVRDKRIGFVLVAWAAYTLFTGFLSPFIDNYAHLGGMIGGGLVALGLRPRLLSALPPG